jgi:predicted nucleotidyltransferase
MAIDTSGIFCIQLLYMFEISEKQKEKISEVCRRFGISVLLLFGSQVSGKTHSESDIDLAFAGRRLTFEEEAAFNAELQAILGQSRVQTVNIFKTSPLLKKRIFDEHIPLYVADAFLYHSLAGYAIKSYLETKHLREALDKYLHQKYVRQR